MNAKGITTSHDVINKRQLMNSPSLLQELSVENDTVKFIFSEQFRTLGCIKDDFWVKYAGCDLETVPREVLLIPLVLNIAPLVWVSGKEFSVETMDEPLYNALNNMKEILQSIYPEIKWSGELIPNNISNIQTSPSNKIAVLFSGGVDSTYTSLHQHDQSQVLICIRGGDAGILDNQKWEHKRNYVREFAETFGHDAVFVESNLSKFINGRWIRHRLPSIQSWWNNVQHGMGLIGLAAQPAWQHQANKTYISSGFHSFTSLSLHDDALKNMSFRWGSNAIMDNAISWCGLRTIHFGGDKSRQDKIEFITCEFGDEVSMELLVCNKHSPLGSINGMCCRCQKCTRTMTGILVSGHHFRRFGFNSSDREFTNVCTKLIKRIDSIMDLEKWLDIRSHLKPMDFYKSRGFSPDLLDFFVFIDMFDFRACYRRWTLLASIKNWVRYMRRRVASNMPYG